MRKKKDKGFEKDLERGYKDFKKKVKKQGFSSSSAETLEELLGGIPKGSIHSEVNTGGSKGKEIW